MRGELQGRDDHMPPHVPLCKHDWVGDDNCAYCRVEELQATLKQIHMFACYASEEDTDSRQQVLLQIGAAAQTALAKAGL